MGQAGPAGGAVQSLLLACSCSLLPEQLICPCDRASRAGWWRAVRLGA